MNNRINNTEHSKDPVLLQSVCGILQARIPEWVAVPFSRGSSWPRDWTWVSHIAGSFFTIWVTKEAPPRVNGGQMRSIPCPPKAKTQNLWPRGALMVLPEAHRHGSVLGEALHQWAATSRLAQGWWLHKSATGKAKWPPSWNHSCCSLSPSPRLGASRCIFESPVT